MNIIVEFDLSFMLRGESESERQQEGERKRETATGDERGGERARGEEKEQKGEREKQITDVYNIWVDGKVDGQI